MDFKSTEAFKKLALTAIYRLFLKNMKYYPSKNRFELLTSIQEEFHDNKKMTDEQKIKKERIKAEMGLRHMYYYIHKNSELMSNKYHNTDIIEPFAKKKQDMVYF